MMIRLFYVFFVIGIFTGCSSWPHEGRGGWAEAYHPLSHKGPKTNDDNVVEKVVAEYDHLSLKLELLKSRGVQQCMPGRLYQVELLHTRIYRTIAAELFDQALLDLRAFYHQLHQFSNHFERIRSATQCANGKASDGVKFQQKLVELLNSDNQFAFNDVEVTPKYLVRLNKAAELLKMLPNTRILLTGHADMRGSADTNYELALKRAESVKQWLVMYGVSTAQLETRANGSTQPFSTAAESAAKQHSDRRVDADVITYDGVSSPASNMKIERLSDWTNGLSEQGIEL